MNVIGILERSLDAASLCQQTISNNIANADTPNYKPKRVVFEGILQETIRSQSSFIGKRTDGRHVPIGYTQGLPAPFLAQENSIVHNNANGVDLDYEMSKMAENSLKYNSLVQQLNHEFNLLKVAIKGRV